MQAKKTESTLLMINVVYLIVKQNVKLSISNLTPDFLKNPKQVRDFLHSFRTKY